MLDQLVQASQALQSCVARAPAPAACVCSGCGAQRMITSPAAIRCARCDIVMQPLAQDPEGRQAPVSA